MTIEYGVAVLFQLRRQGFAVRRSPMGNIQVSPPGRLSEEAKEMIRRNKAVILEALERETAPGAGEAERKARELLNNGKNPWAVATETEGEWTFVSCLRRDGSGWTVRIPKDKFDPFRLTEALLRVDPGGVVH
jgi:hypothetical protein